MPIPNVIHFIFFGFTNFELYHYLAVATANAVHKPDRIYMYNEVEPQNNFWWELTKEIVEVVHMKSPDEYRGIKLTSYQYKADITRMEKLLEQGGIYMDIDVLSLKPFGDLLNNPCVVGSENGDNINSRELEDMKSITNAVILSTPNHPYIRKWYDEIANNIVGKAWAYHAVCLPKEILVREPSVYDVVLEPRVSFMPFCFRNDLVFNESRLGEIGYLDNSYTIHLWETIWHERFLSKMDIMYFAKKNIFTKLFANYITCLKDRTDIANRIGRPDIIQELQKLNNTLSMEPVSTE